MFDIRCKFNKHSVRFWGSEKSHMFKEDSHDSFKLDTLFVLSRSKLFFSFE
jgi:hypothetical protein